MFNNKKIIKKLSVALAVAVLGVGFGGMTITEAQMASNCHGQCKIPETPKYYTEEPSYYLQHPKNIKTVSINTKNKQYFASNFPLQKVGTTKTFKNSKSYGTIRYEENFITLTENVNKKNPQFTYIKKLPNGYTVNDIKKLAPKELDIYGVGSNEPYEIKASNKKWTYTPYTNLTTHLEYVNKNTVRVIVHIPNDTYEQQKKKINDAGFKLFLNNQAKNNKYNLPVYNFHGEKEYQKALKQAKTEVTNITKQKTASDKTLTQYKNEKSQIDKKITTNKSEQAKLQKQLASLEAQNKKKSTSALKKQISQVQEKQKKLKTEATNLQKQSTSLQSKIKTEQTKNNSLKQKQDKAKANVTNIEKNSRFFYIDY